VATTSLNLKPITPVCGEVRHYDPDEAERARRELQARDLAQGKPAAAMHVYWCDQCQAFHVGHRVGR